jgi:hypothetical protein
VLKDDPDERFLLDGIKYGFRIITDDVEHRNELHIESNNHKICNEPRIRKQIEQQLLTEIIEGKYVITTRKPSIISPLLAIPKDNGSVRILQDCSKPLGSSVNDRASSDFKIRYQGVQDAINLLKPDHYMCKLDIRSAYRSVYIHPKDYPVTGIKWTFQGNSCPTYMYDTRLMQGAKLSPMIFHRLSQAIRRFAAKQGIQVVAFPDDFFIISHSENAARSDQHTMIRLLHELGFDIAWEKVEGPSKSLVFLGVELNSHDMSIALPEKKIVKFTSILRQFQHKKRASFKQLERLCGKLSWAATVVKAGRCYLRRLFDLLSLMRKSTDKTRLTAGFYDDISWWLHVMNTFSGRRILCNRPVHTIFMDACDSGSGFMYNGDWGYVNWALDLPEMSNAHINIKETISAIFAVRRWALNFENSKVVFITDNMTARANISKGTSCTPDVMPWLRELHYVSTIYNFDIVSVHIPGDYMPADDLSRLVCYGNFRNFMFMQDITSYYEVASFMLGLPMHMSYKTAYYIYQQAVVRDNSKKNWTQKYHTLGNRRSLSPPKDRIRHI